MRQQNTINPGMLAGFTAAIVILSGLTMGSMAFAVDMDTRVMESINERIAPVGKVRVGQIQLAAANTSASKVDAKGAYQASCFACHGTGAAGAPKLGDKGAWKARIAQGKSTLYDHAIKGFKAMPPRGGSGLDDATLKAVVDYMVAESK